MNKTVVEGKNWALSSKMTENLNPTGCVVVKKNVRTLRYSVFLVN